MKHPNQPSASPRTVRLWTSMVALTSLAAGTLCGCKPAAPAIPPPPIVQVMDITPSNATASVEFIGQLDSPQNVEVRARVEAFVDKTLFTEGTEVKEGAPLFKLDDRPSQERLAAANGALAEAKASLKKYEADVARLTPLAEKRAVPQQDLDNARAYVDVAKAALLSAQARVQSAMLDLSYCDVKAPVSGLIGAKQVSMGELVGKGLPTLLVTISTLDPIWFYCNVSEVQYLRAETEAARSSKRVQDLPVSLVLADGSIHPDLGKFVFIDRAVDAKTATIRVRAEFANASRILRPGMFGRIKVDLGTRPNTILVPERAVAELQGKTFVWVIGTDNKAKQRSVKVGGQMADQLIIQEGLKPAERIVIEGLQKVREDVAVQPMTAEQVAQLAAAQAGSEKTAKE